MWVLTTASLLAWPIAETEIAKSAGFNFCLVHIKRSKRLAKITMLLQGQCELVTNYYLELREPSQYCC